MLGAVFLSACAVADVLLAWLYFTDGDKTTAAFMLVFAFYAITAAADFKRGEA
jgi:hypothetical protein